VLGKRSRTSEENISARDEATISCGPNKRLKIEGPPGNTAPADRENIEPGTELMQAKTLEVAGSQK